MAAEVGYVTNFTRIVKILVQDISKSIRGKTQVEAAQFERIRKRILMAIQLEPVLIVEIMGGHLYRYREKVYELDEKFFLESSFDADIQASRDDPDNQANRDDKAEIVQQLLPRLKEYARSLPPEDMGSYKRLIVSLLDNYIEYAALRLGIDN